MMIISVWKNNHHVWSKIFKVSVFFYGSLSEALFYKPKVRVVWIKIRLTFLISFMFRKLFKFLLLFSLPVKRHSPGNCSAKNQQYRKGKGQIKRRVSKRRFVNCFNLHMLNIFFLNSFIWKSLKQWLKKNYFKKRWT